MGAAATITEQVDAFFDDADRHGPRWPVLVGRIAPPLLVLPLAILLAGFVPWRRWLIGLGEPSLADALLVLPVLAVLVWLVAAAAPMARMSTQPLLGIACILLAASTWLVRDGAVVLATPVAALGAMVLGIAAARSIRRAVWAMPLLLAAGLSDAHSVDGGITSKLLEGKVTAESSVTFVEPTLRIAPELVQRVDYLVLHLPAASGMWLLGLVDIVALGLLLGLTHLYWLPLPRTAVALAVGLALTLGFGVPVPVLPMLGIAWLLVHARLVWRSTRFSVRRLTYLGG